MRKFLALFLIPCAAAFAAEIAATLPAEATPSHQKIWEPPFYNGVAAQVEKVLITYDDLRREMAPLSPVIRSQVKGQEEYEARMEELCQATLQHLIERALLVTEFTVKGYKVPAKEVENEYQRMLREGFNNKVSDLIDSLRSQGLTIPAYRKRIEENLMAQALTERFRHDLPAITPDQIATYYAAHQPEFAHGSSLELSVITLKPLADEPVDVLKQTAQDLLSKLAAGESFQKLAAQYTQDEKTDWGTLSLNDLAPEVKSAVATLKPGEVSQPVVLDGPQVLLIKVASRTDEGVTALADATEDIRRKLFEAQASAAYEKWMTQLRSKYFVKINA